MDDSSSNGSNSFMDNQLMKERLTLHVKRRIENSNPAVVVPISPEKNTDKQGCRKASTKKLKLKPQTTSSIDSPNDEVSPGHTPSTAEKSPKSHKPDIFTTVLNEKKRSLMQDPEVVEFFNKIYQTKHQRPD